MTELPKARKLTFRQKLVNFFAPENPEQVQAEQVNTDFDSAQVKEALQELHQAAKEIQRASTNFIGLTAALVVKDIRGEFVLTKDKIHAKNSARTKKSV